MNYDILRVIVTERGLSRVLGVAVMRLYRIHRSSKSHDLLPYR